VYLTLKFKMRYLLGIKWSANYWLFFFFWFNIYLKGNPFSLGFR